MNMTARMGALYSLRVWILPSMPGEGKVGRSRADRQDGVLLAGVRRESRLLAEQCRTERQPGEREETRKLHAFMIYPGGGHYGPKGHRRTPLAWTG